MPRAAATSPTSFPWLNPTRSSISWPSVAKNDHLFPELIIVEPDYLVSVTAVAQCIRPTGTRSAWHVLKKFDPFVASEATLLGNLSGQMLDEEVHGLHADYIDTARRFFRRPRPRFSPPAPSIDKVSTKTHKPSSAISAT